MTGTSALEAEITAGLAAAKLRLRFDRVVLRLVSRLKAARAESVPEDQTILFTLTAPIRAPAKTAAVLEDIMGPALLDGEIRVTINGNHARLRRVAGVSAEAPRIIGFVHDPDCDASRILAVAEARLLGQDEAICLEVQPAP